MLFIYVLFCFTTVFFSYIDIKCVSCFQCFRLYTLKLSLTTDCFISQIKDSRHGYACQCPPYRKIIYQRIFLAIVSLYYRFDCFSNAMQFSQLGWLPSTSDSIVTVYRLGCGQRVQSTRITFSRCYLSRFAIMQQLILQLFSLLPLVQSRFIALFTTLLALHFTELLSQVHNAYMVSFMHK